MLAKLQKYQVRLVKSQTIEYKRYLYIQINFSDKMKGIFGERGVGRTTLLFQYLRELESKQRKALYISLDYPFLSDSVDLIEIVEEFVESGGEYLLLDEIHRYENFSIYTQTHFCS